MEEWMKALRGIAIAVAVCMSTAGVAAAQSAIDGVWLGTYTSSSSPNPTTEVLIFQTVGTKVVGAYLSASQSAGTVIGFQYNANTYSFLVTQPVDGCPPAPGTLTVTVNDKSLQYAFAAVSCKGPDNGKGTARVANAAALAAFPGGTPAPAPNVSVAGLWNGVYTSTFSPNPTHEKIFFANFGATTKGIYVSDSSDTGILTGQVTSSHFALSDYDPAPPCPGRAVFQGDKVTTGLDYGFQSTDCQGNIDIGHGRAEPARM